MNLVFDIAGQLCAADRVTVRFQNFLRNFEIRRKLSVY
jgi:hypothetical protein